MLSVEIASYPKSGNTWFRRLTEDYLKKIDDIELHPNDIHQKLDKVLIREGAKYLSHIDDEIFFYKSHIHCHPKMQPDKIIHIYRHPLDVFLSSLNFLNNQAENMNDKIKSGIWINGQAKGVEDILEDNEMDYYFDSFLEHLGSNYYSGMLRDKSNYFEYVRSAMSCEKTISIKYEDLFHDTDKVVNDAMNAVLTINEAVVIDTGAVNAKTKNSSNKKFFWKSKAKNYEDYLSKEQISLFESKYYQQLKELSYI
jgi:hypothetical protein